MEVRGQGRVTFAGVLLIIAGALNVIYGIAAISEAHFFTDADTHFVLSGLNTWGWITVILGVIELTGGFSLLSGNAYGRVIGVIAASFGAIGSLLGVAGAYPFWSLGVFALCVIVLHGLIVYGEPEQV
ncbi:MAG TPA: hypothetical protein VIP57_12090 [Candidatus Dormibacteraeota bacterium]